MIPDGLRRAAVASAAGRQWLQGLPEDCARLSHTWGLRIEQPYMTCHVALVVPVATRDGRAVLKIPMPPQIQLGTLLGDARDREPVALTTWNGQGAVRLLDLDTATNSMLLEECRPGHTLDTLEPNAADSAAAELLQHLHSAACPTDLPRLADRAGCLGEHLTGRWQALHEPFEESLIEQATTLLGTLALNEDNVVLHGDFHQHNILAAERRGWLAIDPLPAVGDPAYDAVQYLLFRKGDLADAPTEWGSVIDTFCSLLGVDSERVKAWIFVRLITDAVAELERGATADQLDAEHGDLWTARLVHRLRH